MGRRTRVALALGAGGARGYAHIGVIEEIEERGYEIVAVAGTSMGALVGGLYAAGQLGPYTSWVRGLGQREIIRLLDPSLRAPGIIRAEKILARVTDLLSGALIEELPISFTAVATDLLAGKEVWLQEGPLDAAIRASIAIPSFITPVVINGRLLADGALMNPIPTAATAASHADVTIAVSLSGGQAEINGGPPAGEAAGGAPAVEAAVPGAAEDMLDWVRRAAAQFFDAEIVRSIFGRSDSKLSVADRRRQHRDEVLEQRQDAAPAGLGMLDIIDMSLDATQSLIARYRLAAYPADLLITIPRTACRMLEFHRAAEMIALGRQATADAIERSATFPSNAGATS
jgi:NTE family protein